MAVSNSLLPERLLLFPSKWLLTTCSLFQQILGAPCEFHFTVCKALSHVSSHLGFITFPLLLVIIMVQDHKGKKANY